MSELVDVLWELEEEEDEALVMRVKSWGEALLDVSKSESRTLSVVLCDDQTIRTLNQQWRDVDGPTDVLSFPMDEGESLDAGEALAPLGDIVISIETATQQAPRHDYSLEEELRYLLVHGLCHLLGFDHGDPEEARAMREMESKLITQLAPEQARPDTPY